MWARVEGLGLFSLLLSSVPQPPTSLASLAFFFLPHSSPLAGSPLLAHAPPIHRAL